jgi:nucleotide-binding universal stress UspA family protein
MKVVVYVDGSVHSQAGAELVRALPLAGGSEVAVLVASTSEPRLGALLNASLEQAAARLVPDGVLLTRASIPGPTAQHVIAYASAFEADLAVVSAQSNSSDVGALLNRMAHQVVEQAPCPVLAVLAPFTGLRRVLLAYDGSSHSQAAARYLTRIPLPPDTELSVLHVITGLPAKRVVPPRWPVGARMVRSVAAPDTVATLEPAIMQHAQHVLAGGLAILQEAGLTARGWLSTGDGADAILRQADVNRADLIVAGSRGLGSLRGRLLGSVSRRLIHKANRSVLIVREGWPNRLEPLDAAENANGASAVDE